MAMLEEENRQLIAKVSELLDKLIAAETFIKELSDKLARARHEAPRTFEVPKAIDGEISFRNQDTVKLEGKTKVTDDCLAGL